MVSLGLEIIQMGPSSKILTGDNNTCIVCIAQVLLDIVRAKKKSVNLERQNNEA